MEDPAGKEQLHGRMEPEAGLKSGRDLRGIPPQRFLKSG